MIIYNLILFYLIWKMDGERMQIRSAKLFPDLTVNGEFADVTLVSDDLIQMKAHKFILSSTSPVLRALLLSSPHPNPLIYLAGVKQVELEWILQFIYAGEIKVPQSHQNDFLKNLKFLKIDTTIENEEVVQEQHYLTVDTNLPLHVGNEINKHSEKTKFLEKREVLNPYETKKETDEDLSTGLENCRNKIITKFPMNNDEHTQAGIPISKKHSKFEVDNKVLNKSELRGTQILSTTTAIEFDIENISKSGRPVFTDLNNESDRFAKLKNMDTLDILEKSGDNFKKITGCIEKELVENQTLVDAIEKKVNVDNIFTKSQQSESGETREVKWSKVQGTGERNNTRENQCKECPYIVPPSSSNSSANLTRHMERHKNTSHECNFCGEVFGNRFGYRNLKKHEKYECSAKREKCNFCRKDFQTKRSLNRHKRNGCRIKREKDGTPAVTCSWQLENGETCGAMFVGKKGLNRHVDKHKRGPNVCPICGKSISKNLKIHLAIKHGENIQEKHTDDEIKQCTECSAKFLALQSLNFHLYNLHNVINADTIKFEKFKCKLCGKKTAAISIMEKHMEIHNTMKMPCQHCGKLFKSDHNLNDHIKNLHTPDEQKRIQCSICTKGFQSEESYNGHMNMHKGLKPFSCEECFKHFQNNSNRAAHMRKLHPNSMQRDQQKKKMQNCVICDYVTTKPYDLKRHIDRKHN